MPEKKKPASKNIVNELNSVIGRVANKVSQISGSARNTISTQIDTALDRKIKAYQEELKAAEAKAKEARNVYYDTGGEGGTTGTRTNRPAMRRMEREENSVYSLKKELEMAVDAKKKWNKYKRGMPESDTPRQA